MLSDDDRRVVAEMEWAWQADRHPSRSTGHGCSRLQVLVRTGLLLAAVVLPWLVLGLALGIVPPLAHLGP